MCQWHSMEVSSLYWPRRKRVRHFVQRRDKIHIGWRVVHRIAAENQQRVHLTCVHVGDKLAERIDVIHGARFDRSV